MSSSERAVFVDVVAGKLALVDRAFAVGAAKGAVDVGVTFVGLLRNQVDHPRHGAGAVERGAAAFDDFHAVDGDCRHLVDAIHRGHAGEERQTVDQNLVVVARQAEQLDLGGAAVLAVLFILMTQNGWFGYCQ